MGSEGAERVKSWRERNPVKIMLQDAKKRAAKRGTRFEIAFEDVVIPETCPVLGIPLVRNVGAGFASPNSPSIDELVHGAGYTPDNILVMSYLANKCKSDLTPEQLLTFADWIYKQFGTESPQHYYLGNVDRGYN